MAEPMTSARSQAAMAISAPIQKTNETGRLKWSRQAARQVASRHHSQLDGQGLQQNGHQVGQHDDGKQRVIVFRAAGQVGGPVARVHVADGHEVSRPGEGQEFAQKASRRWNGQTAIDFRQAGTGDGMPPALAWAGLVRWG